MIEVESASHHSSGWSSRATVRPHGAHYPKIPKSLGPIQTGWEGGPGLAGKGLVCVLTAAARLGQPRALCTLASGPGTVSRPHRVKWLKLPVAPIKRS